MDSVLLLFVVVVGVVGHNSTEACWKHTVTRGAGVPLNACPSGSVKDGALCYPACKDDYKGVGPVCWQNCPKTGGWVDDGATCRIPLKVISADNSHCEWYDKCGLTFDKGCSTCPADQGYVNDGCTCRIPLQIKSKDSYGRGAGNPMICSSQYQQSGALCYPPCPAKYDSVGPVCWEQCTSEFPVKCGAMCGAPGFNCTDQIMKFVKDALHTVEACSSANTIPQCVEAIAKMAKDFALDGICPH